MKIERDYLVQKLKDAGVHGKIHESLKDLKNCNELHVGAVLQRGESFVRSGSKKQYTDQQGQRKQRNTLFDRTTNLRVIIADTSEEKVDKYLTEFLKQISKGFSIDQNWIDIEVGEADWVEEGDSILKSKIAVELDVTLTGSIYKDTELITPKIGTIRADGE